MNYILYYGRQDIIQINYSQKVECYIKYTAGYTSSIRAAKQCKGFKHRKMYPQSVFELRNIPSDILGKTLGYWRSRPTTILNQTTSAHISVTSAHFADFGPKWSPFSEAVLLGTGHQSGPRSLGRGKKKGKGAGL